MANASRTFNENFRRISKGAIEKIQEAIEKKKPYRISYSATDRTKKFLEKEGLAGSGDKHMITSTGVKHIINGHGEGAKLSKGEVPVTMEDIAMIPEIQKNYDTIRLSDHTNTRGQPVIIYKKKIGDIYYYLENYNNTAKYWETQTMYKRKEQ